MRDDYTPPNEKTKTSSVEDGLFSSSSPRAITRTLLRDYRDTAPQQPGRRRTLFAGARDLIGYELPLYEAWLAEVHRYFNRATEEKASLSYASEWVLDNYYILRQSIEEIEQDLPPVFYQQLPKLSGDSLEGLPRVYALARKVLSYQNLIFSPGELEVILKEFQEYEPLTMGELWALPIFLRFGLIESLSYALKSLIAVPNSTELPPDTLSSRETDEDLTRQTGSGDTVDNDAVANAILSLRVVSEVDWNEFFETVSCVERTLRNDPAGIYSRMDFQTRDHYRKEIENLASVTGRAECAVTEAVVELSGANGHVGEYLLGEGRSLLEEKVGYQPEPPAALKRWAYRHASAVYFASIALLSVLVVIAIAWGARLTDVLREFPFTSGNSLWDEVLFAPLQWVAVFLLAGALLVAVLTIATSQVNWLITVLVPPRVLPKLNFKRGIPAEHQTLVVIPAMLTSREEIRSLASQIEQHYLRNPETGLFFALATDFSDADSETRPEDEALERQAAAAVAALNKKYPLLPIDALREKYQGASAQRFYFFHRKRLWNPSEGSWMGWERKRGKLQELNQLLRGGTDLSFSGLTGDPYSQSEALRQVQYVITLDSDTVMPIGAAHRMVGTLAHPLNCAVFDERTRRVVSGYTVLQPRVAIHPRSANLSWFTRIFAGDAGLDLYSLAVSDAYQDLFGEGIYVGKGIYDIDAFEHSIHDHIPENTVLSHDLLEGLMGRAGLVTDITLIEDYPQNYLIQVLRQRRWMRGDWQLLPWLFKSNRSSPVFSVIDRWKMFDNLRRALLAPALTVVFAVGLMAFPQLGGLWTTVLLAALGIPLLTSLTRSALQLIGGEKPAIAFRPLGMNLVRWLLAVAFLIYEGYTAMDAMVTTLYRLFISRRKLLQWTTAAQTTRLFGLNARRNVAWRKMSLSVMVGLVLALEIWLVAHLTSSALPRALSYASLVMALWVFSPVIVWWINRPITEKPEELSPSQTDNMRRLARQTWGFFERFVGPEDHWLPPDHYQETPVGMVAHRTSPTNIGLLLTSTLAAYDLGYLDQFGLSTRLSTTLETMDQLERFRGHFLNWYDTLTLQPLQPRYVSTVDSGNLAASLMVTAQACNTMPAAPIFRWELWQGYLDTLSVLLETLDGLREGGAAARAEEISRRVAVIRLEILAVEDYPERWYPLFLKIKGPFWTELSQLFLELVESTIPVFQQEMLVSLNEAVVQVERHHNAVERIILELSPWIPLLENAPQPLEDPRFREALEGLKTALPYNLAIGKIHKQTETAMPPLAVLRQTLDGVGPEDQPGAVRSVAAKGLRQTWRHWLNDLSTALARADANAVALLVRFEQIRMRAEIFVNEMDFRFLYQPERRVFHIGFNLDAGQLDNNYYDLLASEARIASIVAIARGEVPQSHWLHLSRPITRVEGANVLLSWSGTMFEYLMPPLFLKSYDGTLLSHSIKGAVQHQIAYGKSQGIPWGISESGFYRFDNNQNYQYRAFGAPGLGFKRGLKDDLVIAPYASLMAISYAPREVASNLEELADHEMIGRYGAYEAIDFTPFRLLLDEKYAVVGEYMAHHQGMILMALANYFHEDIMVQRMHSDPRIQSVDLLLQELIPSDPPLQDPYEKNVQGVSRTTSTAPASVVPWRVPVQTSIPQVHLLSNGSYNVLLSNMGGGYSTWRDTDLTRWQPDGVLDSWGNWVYIQEVGAGAVMAENRLWSAGYQPVPSDEDELRVTYSAHMATFRRVHHGLASTMEVTVVPDDPVEIRRVHLYNNTEQGRTLRLTSYGEVILAPQGNDARHPAFNKLFIESEFVPDLSLQIFTRRPRSRQETPILMGHMLVSKQNFGAVSHEADRGRFIGRNGSLRSPAALTGDDYLTGTTGATLDPIFALGQEVELKPHETIELAYVTLTADDREALLELAQRYRNWSVLERSFHNANIAALNWLNKEDITTQRLKNTLKALSALVYPNKEIRASAETLAANQLGQPGLWRFGISGDNPILLVEVDNAAQNDVVREALQVHKFLRSRRFKLDVVLLNLQQTNYGAELNSLLHRLVGKVSGEEWLNQNGGIFILYADQMSTCERTLLRTAARVSLAGDQGTLKAQLPAYAVPVRHLPALSPSRSPQAHTEDAGFQEAFGVDERDDLRFYNGYGGFSADGREYVIELPAGRSTPAPWVNVIGYPEFGFMVSEAGSQCTWAVNSGENRLTPWSNDPVRDPTGEALYLRDEETGEVWTPTPLPAGTGQPYRVTHGAGYTIFEHRSHGLNQRLTLLASPEDPVKIIHLKVENALPYNRRITATQYVEWVLGTTRGVNSAYIIPEYDSSLECLLASNPYNAEFGARVAFLIGSKPVHGLTADRAEFLGRGGSPAFPAALRRLGLEARVTPGEDPCAALQLHLDLLPGETQEIYFALGQGGDKEHALALARKYHDPAHVGAAHQRTQVFWDHLLDTLQVRTPEPATDLILNRWTLYQDLSCRIWGRSGFYQSSGAFGFRDQLQDVLALLPTAPDISRGQLLNAAQHQFEEGDVMHWWHPPSGRGVRTRISDDLLWLPYGTAKYIEATGDAGVLDEEIPFRDAPPLAEGEEERYSEFPPTERTFSLLEHCIRAIEKGTTLGRHGLPLIGTGDWNDGMSQVGEQGEGESVWLAWFLYDVLERFAVVCEQVGDAERAQRYRAQAAQYAAAVEQTSWDGEWYRRAYYDDGFPLGSKENLEARIDAIAQSWSVISGAGDPARSALAMQSALEYLVRPEDRLLMLFTPPFDKTPRNPGYIKGYRPGIRENGGQYTHGAVWTAWAFARLGEGKRVGELFNLLNPVLQADSQKKADVYRVEPYVVCADIYSTEPYVRRGGWTWYTGSAAWLYRLGVEEMLGFKKQGKRLRIDPVIPPHWDGYEMRYRFGEGVYRINVRNPDHVSRNVRKLLLNGERLTQGFIPLREEKGEHEVEVTLGQHPNGVELE